MESVIDLYIENYIYGLKFTESYFQVSCMRDCNTEFDETSVDKSNTPESDTTINNTSGVNNEEENQFLRV
jgi:hypothetical protein